MSDTEKAAMEHVAESVAHPCPTCHLPDGFHDNEEPDGLHAAARSRIPADLRYPPNSIARADRGAEKHAAYLAWLDRQKESA